MKNYIYSLTTIIIFICAPISWLEAQGIVGSDAECWSEIFLSRDGTQNGRNNYRGTGTSTGSRIYWVGGQWVFRSGTTTWWYTNANTSPNPPSSEFANSIGFPWIDGGIGCGTALDLYGDGTITNLNLPVELVDFNVQLKNEKALLIWETESEINNLGFELQRSTDGLNWDQIKFIEGKGTHYQSHKYSYIDNKPNIGINYYRLKQIDFDGKFEFSKIISIEVLSQNKISLFPNPANDHLEIQGIKNAKIIITNVLGRTMLTSSFSESNIDISQLVKGVYFIQVNTANSQVIMQFIKK